MAGWFGCGEPTGQPVEEAPSGPPYAPVWDGEPLGGERPVEPVLPVDYDVNKRWPLVIALHGFSASPDWIDDYFGVRREAEERGFIALMPEGTLGAGDLAFWNATPACCDFADVGVDDVAYLSALIEEAQERLAVDPERIYFMGHSNGGFMSYRMACELSEKIRGVAVASGSSLADASACGTPSPLRVLHVHGTEDNVIPYQGGSFGRDDFPGVQDVVARWVERNGCAGVPTEEGPVDLSSGVFGRESTIERWAECESGMSVELWTVNGADHFPWLNLRGQDALFDALLDED
ncbi:alpha/beta hydrolase family esterase [Lujinxingia litoralis]|nr:PHB depolymerase family esterase [Lujinxingia litoralis]